MGGRQNRFRERLFRVGEQLHNEYGSDGIPQNFFQLATMKGKGQSVIAYYDGSNVALNERFLNSEVFQSSYDDCVRQGFHPPRGSKSAAEAVAAHELAHRLTDAAGAKMGGISLDAAANRIVMEARRQTTHRGVVQMASRISKYATANNAETIAEAFSDVFCNGGRAKRESRAVFDVLNKYVKGQ